jgi:uncharacterized membrane protein
MPQLSQAKTLGGVGSILMLLSFAPAVGWVLAIAGAIMVLIAIKHISDIVEDKSIFNNMLLAIIFGIVGLVVGIAVIIGTVLAVFGLGNLSSWFSSIPKGVPGVYTAPAIPSGGWVSLITGALAGLAIIWVLLIISAILVRRSYSSISLKLGVGMFNTAGLFYLIGAALTIVVVGVILLFVAMVLNVVAFFSIPDQQMPQSAPPQPMQPATM